MSKVSTEKKSTTTSASDKKNSVASAKTSDKVTSTKAKSLETKSKSVTEKETDKPETISILPACKDEIKTGLTVKEEKQTGVATTEKKHTELTKTSALCKEKVASCAYLLWEKEGYQHGRDVEYWIRAEEELKKELASTCN